MLRAGARQRRSRDHKLLGGKRLRSEAIRLTRRQSIVHSRCEPFGVFRTCN